MNKQIKHTSTESSFPIVPSFNRKILPLKHKFFTFQSEYDYRADFQPMILQIRIKNPKWCHLSLKLGHRSDDREYSRLRRTRSLRLRSVHLESFGLDAQGCGDEINGYRGELDVFTRVGHTLKKLSLSVTHRKNLDAINRLEKFVKKQKHLEEFGLYLGDQGDTREMFPFVKIHRKISQSPDNWKSGLKRIFRNYQFRKLETLRFDYMQFFRSEDTFIFDNVIDSLDDILALPKLKALVFSQYQRYYFDAVGDDSEGYSVSESEEEAGQDNEEVNEEETDKEHEEKAEKDSDDENEGKIDSEDDENSEEEEENLYVSKEIPSEFWEKLRKKLDEYKDTKPLKIKYHRKDDQEFEQKVKNFKRIFQGLPEHQTFEYEITQFSEFTDEEVIAKGLEIAYRDRGRWNFHQYWTGVRYLISLDKVESF